LYNELRVAYARLNELDQLKDAFLVTVNHELRTPLTVVQGCLALLDLMESPDPALRGTILKNARHACEELVMLFETMMDASRLEHETVALHCTNIVLKDLCAAVMELFETRFLQEQRSITLAIAENITVYADEIRVKQILRNLVINALHYSAPGTPLAIAATPEAEQHRVRIEVRDRGFGIPPDQQEAIFERFVRLERERASGARGSGLGLAIARQLVEAMHGTIRVQSNGVKGEGSTFLLTLPVGLCKREEGGDT
jgi:signal transduction histidine kinase